jgi:hypothetical protein
MNTKVISVHVKQEHIDAGCKYRNDCCAIANALRAQGYPNARVFSTGIDLAGRDRFEDEIPNSIRVRRFIKKFDAGKPVKPFSFRLVVPA